jgi:hypothetical protein
MELSNWHELCAYMSSLWGREMTHAQKAAGFKLLGPLPNSAVENALVNIAEEGGDRIPPWPVLYKAARSIAEAERERMPALPQGDTLTDVEHQGVMILLRAKQTPEQRRRADRMMSETKGLPMKVQLKLAGELLRIGTRVDPPSWDRLFDEALAAARLADAALPMAVTA